MELRPLFRPAVQAAGHLLLVLDRDREALDLLTEAGERLECAAVVSQLAALQDELGRHEDARRSYERFGELSPLPEKEIAQWWAARRSDILYNLGDVAGARDQALQAGEGFHQTVAQRLSDVADGARRVVLTTSHACPGRCPRPSPPRSSSCEILAAR